MEPRASVRPWDQSAPAAPQPPTYNNGNGSYPAPVVDSSNGTYGNNGNGTYNNGNPGYNNGNNAGYSQTASGSTWGTVVRIDNLGTNRSSGLGAALGAGVGAIAGSQIGRSMNDAKTTGTVVGAIGGGLIGNAIEHGDGRPNHVGRTAQTGVAIDNERGAIH